MEPMRKDWKNPMQQADPPLSNSQDEWSRKLPPPPDIDTCSFDDDETQSQGVQQQEMSIFRKKISQKCEKMLESGNIWSKRHQDQIRTATWKKLKDAGKDYRWYTANVRRWKKVLNSVEEDLGFERDKLLRGEDQRALTAQNFNDFFGVTIFRPNKEI